MNNTLACDVHNLNSVDSVAACLETSVESRSGHCVPPRAKLKDTSVKRRVPGRRDEADDESEAQGRSSSMAEQASACEFTVDQGESCELEATQVPGKRVLLLINSTMTTASMAKLASQDVRCKVSTKVGHVLLQSHGLADG